MAFQHPPRSEGSGRWGRRYRGTAGRSRMQPPARQTRWPRRPRPEPQWRGASLARSPWVRPAADTCPGVATRRWSPTTSPSRGRAGPVRESQHTEHRHGAQGSAEVAPQCEQDRHDAGQSAASSDGTGYAHEAPGLSLSLPRSSSSVGLSVKGDRLQNSVADAGRRRRSSTADSSSNTEPRAGAGRDLTAPLSARRLARGKRCCRSGPAWSPAPRRPRRAQTRTAPPNGTRECPPPLMGSA